MTAVTAAEATHTAQLAATAEDTLPQITEPLKVSPKDARALSRQFFDRLTVLEEGTPEYQYARNTLIEMNLSLVRYAAARFRSRSRARWRTSSRSARSA